MMVSVRFRSGKSLSPNPAARGDPQHRPKSQGGDDRNPAIAPRRAAGSDHFGRPSWDSGLKFSSNKTQVRQRISLSTISEGLKGASFRVADTRWRAIVACAGWPPDRRAVAPTAPRKSSAGYPPASSKSASGLEVVDSRRSAKPVHHRRLSKLCQSPWVVPSVAGSSSRAGNDCLS